MGADVYVCVCVCFCVIEPYRIDKYMTENVCLHVFVADGREYGQHCKINFCTDALALHFALSYACEVFSSFAFFFMHLMLKMATIARTAEAT